MRSHLSRFVPHPTPTAAGLGRCRFRFLSCSLIAGLMMGGLSLAAEKPPESVESSGVEFFIETITVENAERFTPEIIVSESLLQEGRVYSERELRDAVHRIVRLPLILGADFSLRKGSERGRYELVITVEETRRWFFGFQSLQEEGDDLRQLPEPGLELIPSEVVDPDDDLALFAAWRTSAGRFGVFSAALDPTDDGTFQLGYTHYNLFRRSIQLNLNLLIEPLDRRDLDPELYGDLDFENRQARLSIAVPIKGNHSLRLAGSYRASDIRHPGSNRDWDRLTADLSWVYNSIDDPVLPASGWFVRGGLEYHALLITTSRIRRFGPDAPVEVTSKDDLDEYRLTFAGDRYWPLSRLHSVSLSLDLSAGRSDTPVATQENLIIANREFNIWDIGLTFGYARFLWQDRVKPRWRELRWESELEWFHEGTSPDLGLRWNPRIGVRIGTGLVLRTTWGVFRYRLDYFQTNQDR